MCHDLAVDKGFWNCPYFDGGTCCNNREFPTGVPTEITADYCKKECRYQYDRNDAELLMLIVSELGEALEALRKGDRQISKKDYNNLKVKEIGGVIIGGFKFPRWKKDTFEDELADAVIRILDLAEARGIDLEWQIMKKLEYNKSRPYKHGKKF